MYHVIAMTKRLFCTYITTNFSRIHVYSAVDCALAKCLCSVPVP